MKTLAQCWPRSLTAASAAVALVAVAGGARAQQTDTNPPLPNVMLLIDNSGSMERMINGATPETDPSTAAQKTPTGTNACNCIDQGPGNPPSCPDWSKSPLPTAPSPNRWNIVQTALTGSLQGGFNCVAMPRDQPGKTFDKEYQIAHKSPYDLNYYLPVHRLVYHDPSGIACVVAPGGLPGTATGQGVGPNGDAFPTPVNASDFPAGAIVAREYGLLPPNAVACKATGTQGAVQGFLQYPDGAVTSMRDLMRFGMMTFDSDPDPGTGVTGAYPTAAVGPTPFTGMWTYNWAGTNVLVPPVGDPPNCPTLQQLAVGARNPSAPPWEGRLVPFPAAATPDLAHQEQTNDVVSSVVLASRAYGATPLAGMFSSAQYYFFNDPTGPSIDPYVKGTCRSEYIILLTDGTPNLDLQPSCSASGGKCPFPLPYSATGTVAALYGTGTSTSSQASVKTYVIGFALSDPNNNPVNCSQFDSNGSCGNAPYSCSNPDLANAGPYGPCCVLECIARNGSGGNNSAYFAQTQGDLQKALGAILADIAKNTTTRTTPAYPPAATSVISSTTTPGLSNQSIYLASFNASPGKPWSGDVVRQRSVCTYSGGFTIPPPTVTSSQGDDFAVNLATGSPARTFIVYSPTTAAGTPMSGGATLRPYALPGVDGAGQGTVTMHSGPAASVDTLIDPAALGIQPGGCPYTSTVNGSVQPMAPAACAQMLLDYTFGSSFSGPPDFSFTSRAGANALGQSNAFGSIYHATPIVVGPPGSLLQDPGYIGFASVASPNGWGPRTPAPTTAADCAKGGQGRCTVTYVATNDGLLHAFWADEPKQENNELWAMLLPGVMPNINGGSYPSSHAFLLDGSPVVKDVVWDRAVVAGGVNTLGGSDPAAWHTMLVAGYGSSQAGYYAVDVTNPDPSGLAKGGTPTVDPPPPGPVFRWQMTTVPSGNMPLFGAHSATPALTTLYMDPTGGNNPREIGVAILPGGVDTAPTTQAKCARDILYPVSDYTVRDSVRCWGNPPPPSGGGSPPAQSSADFVVGRSVTIVRVDTGEIVRVFARQSDMNLYPNDTVKRFTPVHLDSPMTGTPTVYPNDVGADSTKFFIGDADGTIWRFDLSSPFPQNWSGAVYVDLYNKVVDGNATSWSDGQSIQVPPVLSLDPAANLVLNVASGTTDQFDATGIEYVYSITEKVLSSGSIGGFVNWWMQPAAAKFDNQPGERVSGPMTVFNGVLYFSTFATGTTGSQVCANGAARIWGRDFILPADTQPGCATGGTCDRSLGGAQRLTPAPALPYIEPDTSDPSLAGKVIPGVTIKSTPACASLGTPGNDQYVYGAQHSAPQNYTQPGGYSLFTQIGAKGATGSTTKTFEMTVPSPVSPTVIDSWAAVLE